MSLTSLLGSELDKLSLNGSGNANGGLAYGDGAGLLNQDISSVAIGRNAGQASQGLAVTTFPNPAGGCVAIGLNAGQTSQRAFSVAIGAQAGMSGQGGATLGGAIAIGAQAGMISQGDYSVAIGYNAGRTNQGAYAVAVGANIGLTVPQHENTVCLNSGSAGYDTEGTGRFYVQPIRGIAHGIGVGRMYYDPNTNEVSYSTT